MLRVFFTAILISINPGYSLECSRFLRKPHSFVVKSRERLTDEFKIYYFPKNEHMRLVIGENAVGYISRTYRDRKSTVSEFGKTNILTDGPQIIFHMRATPDEVQKINQYINSGEFGSTLLMTTCSTAVCNAINKNTGLKMPEFLYPGVQALYLMISRLFPGNRVKKVSYEKFENDQDAINAVLNIGAGVLIESVIYGVAISIVGGSTYYIYFLLEPLDEKEETALEQK